LQAFADGTDQVRASVAVEEREAPPAGRVVDAQTLGVGGMVIENVIEERDETVKGVQEFDAVFVSDGVQVAGD
jgi:hypothetical protein